MKPISRAALLLCFSVLAAGCAGLCQAETVTSHELMIGTPYQTTYYVKTGAEPGPTIVVIGGVHGDEPAGYLSARKALNWKITHGTLWLLPDAHKEAIRRNTRGYPGNMNNMFPGKANGDSMEQLAYQIFEMIRAAHPDLLLTLHESREFHVDNPTRFGQTFCYDFHDLDPLMERVQASVNRALPPGKYRFQRYVDPYPHCPTYQAYVQFHTPSASIETCREAPLEDRVQQQLLVLEAFFDDRKLGYEQNDVPRLAPAAIPEERTAGQHTPTEPGAGPSTNTRQNAPSNSPVGPTSKPSATSTPVSGSPGLKNDPASDPPPPTTGNSSTPNEGGVSRFVSVSFLAAAAIFAFAVWRFAFSNGRRTP